MFIRKKKNKSGKISIQVIDKGYGKYKVMHTVGCSSSPSEIDQLILLAEQWIKTKKGLQELDFSNEIFSAENFLNSIEQIRIEGTNILLGKIFDEIGFDQIKDALFKQLVLSRLCFPVSKLKTTDFLSKYHFVNVEVQHIYRYMDKLYNTQQELVQQISYRHTLNILDGKVSIVFYDVTTLYFEIDDEDDLRKKGFSKDGKHEHPQIVLGLLVSMDGYPLAYEIFEGNKFEGHTMLPVIEAFKSKYNLKKLVIIADSGLLSTDNIQDLQKNDYEFILGARIKAEKQTIKQEILSIRLSNGESQVIKKEDGLSLIVSYSDSRAKKDKANRERGLKKLEKQINSGRLTKSNINNKGYNKYLRLEGEIKISIDLEKFNQDAQWDGLKGYLTNTNLSKEQIIDNYSHLWKIEKAFRISKHDLKIRPFYHRIHRRIQAHVCISFVAYKVYKELERQLKAKGSKLSVEHAIDIAKTIYLVKVITPITKESVQKTLILNEDQKYLANLFSF